MIVSYTVSFVLRCTSLYSKVDSRGQNKFCQPTTFFFLLLVLSNHARYISPLLKSIFQLSVINSGNYVIKVKKNHKHIGYLFSSQIFTLHFHYFRLNTSRLGINNSITQGNKIMYGQNRIIRATVPERPRTLERGTIPCCYVQLPLSVAIG